MINIKSILDEFPLISLHEGENLLTQGNRTRSLFFLKDGEVDIFKDGTRVASSSEHGSVFGEMSMLLGSEHSATVQCVSDSSFYHIEDPIKCMGSHPEVIWHIAQMLSMRINNLNSYFVEVKSQHQAAEEKAEADMDYRKIMADEAMKILRIQH